MLPNPPINVAAAATGGLTTNAAITTTRKGANPLQGERVLIKAPTRQPTFGPGGLLVTTEIILAADRDIQAGDAIHVDQLDGFTALDKQEGYTVAYVARIGSAGAPTTRAYVEDTIR